MLPLKEKLEVRIQRLKREITSKENALKRAQLDLENLSFTESRLKKQRETKLKKAGAPRKVKEVKSTSEANISADDKIEIPTLEMRFGSAAPIVDPSGEVAEALEEVKKSKLTFW